MYVCLCIYICISVWMTMHAYPNEYTHARTCIQGYKLSVFMYIYIFIHRCIHTYIHTCIYIYVCIHTRTHFERGSVTAQRPRMGIRQNTCWQCSAAAIVCGVWLGETDNQDRPRECWLKKQYELLDDGMGDAANHKQNNFVVQTGSPRNHCLPSN